MIECGLEVFLKKDFKRFQKKRLGLLCNQASVTRELRHASAVLLDPKLGLNISWFLGTQHGIRGEKQDNMVESKDFLEPNSKKPVFSLYADTRVPTPRMLEHLDVFLIDLQDVGTRIYTFMYTMENCMRAAKNRGIPVVVLDRPNPIGGVQTEGNVLDLKFSSFVGQQPICTRHGMTMGELALLFNVEFQIECELEIIRVKGWKRSQYADSWGRGFVPPSPNIPVLDSAITFPGGVHFEGTNISEGRGTTKPFEFVGAPFIDPDKLANHLNSKRLQGTYFRPIFFQPTYQKWKDALCGGVQIHVIDRQKFNSFRAGIELLGAIAQLYPKHLEWKKPPYEYEYERNPLDLITGTNFLRFEIEREHSVKKFLENSTRELAKFRKVREKYLLYK